MFRTPDFMPLDLGITEYKLLGEIVCDELVNQCNVDDEYVNNEVIRNFTYKIELKSGVEPIFRAIYDILDHTTTKEVDDIAQDKKNEISGFLKVGLWIVNKFPTRIKDFYLNPENKDKYKELGKSNLEKIVSKLYEDQQSGGKYLEGVANVVMEGIRNKIEPCRQLGILKMYAKTTYIRRGIRLSYKKMYGVDKSFSSAINFFEAMERDFQDIGGYWDWSYSDPYSGIYRVQDCLGTGFQMAFIRNWRNEHFMDNLVFVSSSVNSIGEVSTAENTFDKFDDFYNEAIITAPELIQKSYEVNQEAFGVKTVSGVNIEFTNIDWFKAKYLSKICDDLSNLYNGDLEGRSRKSKVLSDSMIVSTGGKKRFSLYPLRDPSVASEVKYRFSNRIELLNFIYENYDKFTPTNIDKYLDKFLDIADRVQIQKDKNVFLIKDNFEVMENGRKITINIRDDKYSIPEYRRELRKYSEYMEIANDWFKKYISAVLVVKKLQTQLLKWGFSIINFNSDLVKRSLSDSTQVSLREYMLTNKTTPIYNMSNLNDCFDIEDFISNVSSMDIRNRLIRVSGRELLEKATDEEIDRVFKFVSDKMLTVKQLTNLTKIYKEDESKRVKTVDLDETLAELKKLKGNLLFSYMSEEYKVLLGYREDTTKFIIPHKLDMENDEFCNRLVNNIIDQLKTCEPKDKLSSVKSLVGLALVNYISFNQIKGQLIELPVIDRFIQKGNDFLREQNISITLSDVIKMKNSSYLNLWRKIVNQLVISLITPDEFDLTFLREGFEDELIQDKTWSRFVVGETRKQYEDNRTIVVQEISLSSAIFDILGKKVGKSKEENRLCLNKVFPWITIYPLVSCKAEKEKALSFYSDGNPYCNTQMYNVLVEGNLNGVYLMLRKYEVQRALNEKFSALRENIEGMNKARLSNNHAEFIRLYEKSNIENVLNMIRAKSSCDLALSDESTMASQTVTKLREYIINTLGVEQVYPISKSTLKTSAEKKLSEITAYKMVYIFICEYMNSRLASCLEDVKLYTEYCIDMVKEEYGLGEKISNDLDSQTIFNRNKKSIEEILTREFSKVYESIDGSASDRLSNPISEKGLSSDFISKYELDSMKFLMGRGGYLMHVRDHTSTDGLLMYGFIHITGWVIYVCDRPNKEDTTYIVKLGREAQVVRFDTIKDTLTKEGVI